MYPNSIYEEDKVVIGKKWIMLNAGKKVDIGIYILSTESFPYSFWLYWLMLYSKPLQYFKLPDTTGTFRSLIIYLVVPHKNAIVHWNELNQRQEIQTQI